MSNIYQDLLKHFTYNADLVPTDNIKAIKLYVSKIQAEYDKLCPKPEKFKEAKHVAINPSNIAYSYLQKPKTIKREWNAPCYTCLGQIEIPLGLDWRLCVWSIEDAKRIWGED